VAGRSGVAIARALVSDGAVRCRRCWPTTPFCLDRRLPHPRFSWRKSGDADYLPWWRISVSWRGATRACFCGVPGDPQTSHRKACFLSYYGRRDCMVERRLIDLQPYSCTAASSHSALSGTICAGVGWFGRPGKPRCNSGRAASPSRLRLGRAGLRIGGSIFDSVQRPVKSVRNFGAGFP